jgi:PTS system mannose-specific IIA component
MFDRHEFAETP